MAFIKTIERTLIYIFTDRKKKKNWAEFPSLMSWLNITEIWNHRTVCVGRDLKGQSNSCGQGHLQLEQIVQWPIQTGPKHFKGWNIHSFSRQLSSVLHHPYSKSFFTISNVSLFPFTLKPFPFVLSLHVLVKTVQLSSGPLSGTSRLL